MYQYIESVREGDFEVVTMVRPEKRNALSEAHLRELLDAFEHIAHGDARGAILAARGPVFSAGHDFSDMAPRDEKEMRSLLDVCSELMQKLTAIPQVVIAQVEGLATAAGCQLVASCDLAVASEDARFATPGVNIGLFCSTPMVAVSRNVSRKAAMEMLLLGDMVGAKEAKDIGLVNRVVPPDETVNAAVELGRKIAEKPKATLKIGKEAFYRQLEMPLADAYAYTSRVMTENMLARDAEEGIDAFLEKREPKWEGR